MTNVAQKRPISEAGNALEDVKAVLVGSEGTVSPRSFAKDTLQNHLRECLKPFLEQNFDSEEVKAAIEELRAQVAGDSEAGVEGVVAVADKDANQANVVDSVVASVLWLLNSGRKTDALKHLQGLVWSSGFKNGKIFGSVHDDVVQAFEKLIQDDIKVYVYSSFGVETQRLLLSFSNHGDLSDMISGFFDTNSAGAGVEKESYAKIASSIQLNPENILYITSQPTEVTAAHAAGLKTSLMVRDKDEVSEDNNQTSTSIISTFADIFPEGDMQAKRICPGDRDAVGVDDGSEGSDGKGTSDEAAEPDGGDESPLD